MKPILFGASVFYLLGLKLTTQIHVNQPHLPNPTTIESKFFQEDKAKQSEKIVKPEAIVKDTTVSAGKTNQSTRKADQKNVKFPATRKGAV